MKRSILISICLFAIAPSLLPASESLEIPNSDKDVPGVGPIRRTEWFRGVWRNRRAAWQQVKESEKNAVVLLGDSITQGWGEDLKPFFGDLKVVNRGITGDTSRGLLLRLQEDVIRLDPRAVVIMIGANDLAEKASGEIVFENVKRIINKLKAHNPQLLIVLCETFPCAPDNYRPVPEIQKINSLYADTWSEDEQVTIAKTYSLFADSSGASQPRYLPDRVHPNAAGYARWAEAMRPIFTELKLRDSTPEPHAWINFNRFDHDVALYNGYYIFYTDRGEPLELTLDVAPDPAHQLAFQWVTKHGPIRSMTIELNGQTQTVRHPSRGDGQQAFFWDALPVSEFGIKERQRDGKYRLKITCPDDAEDDAVITAIRLITHSDQLTRPNLAESRYRITLDAPGSLSAEERAATRVNRQAARARVHSDWLANDKLTDDQIAEDEFLVAAKRFGDTVITHGRDTYGPVHTPMFARYLHREKLKAPASIASMPPALGGASHPIVQTQFDRMQNLLRTLAGLSKATGDARYVDAATDATIHMFEEYAMPHSGLIVFGNHMTIDLMGDRTYSDGRSGDIFELENVFPFYEFWHAVSPEKTERFVKGCWEVYVRDWHTMHYNRHAGFNKNIDFTQTWNRPFQEVRDLPTKIEVLGFIDVGLDLAFAGYTIGCLQDDEKARRWGDRYLRVLSYHRDPKTNIWPMLLYTPSIRRHLEVYREVFPDANVTEPRVIISSWIYNMPIFFLGALGTVEHADSHGYSSEVEESQKRINEWILGYMAAAYDSKTHTMRSIILDGTDVTDHVFQEGKVLHGWGAKAGDSFRANPPSPIFLAAIARAYRLADDQTRKEYWPLLRSLFRGDELGELGEAPTATPQYQFGKVVPEPPYLFALADLYRVHQHPETLELMESIGRDLITQRQDPQSGLFSLPPDRPYTIRHNQRTQEPWEGLSTAQHLQSEFNYDRPKVVSLDAIDPLALLAVHACRIGRFELIPQWYSGGKWGTGSSCGHVIDHQLERWFDREKLQKYYSTQKPWLDERGYEIDAAWFPR